MSSKEEFLKRIAQLETINDQLRTELDSLGRLLMAIGFKNGISSLKEAALDLLEDPIFKKHLTDTGDLDEEPPSQDSM